MAPAKSVEHLGAVEPRYLVVERKKAAKFVLKLRGCVAKMEAYVMMVTFEPLMQGERLFLFLYLRTQVVSRAR